ncbi:MAG: hypothetical protein K8I82_14300 [Anaerolineae bacterium]|nr:hypothetical protein [Anaerolineae bacterium]
MNSSMRLTRLHKTLDTLLNFIMETVNTQTPVEVTSRLDNNGRLGYTAFYEIQLDDGTLAILQVAIGSNGFIVTASPSKLPK